MREGKSLDRCEVNSWVTVMNCSGVTVGMVRQNAGIGKLLGGILSSDEG
jgi:hypothetical protein